MNTAPIRLFSKLAALCKVRGASIAKTQVYNKVHADLRSAATSKFANAVEFRKKSIILAAGGTGGHLFPALALAEELYSRDQSNIWIFTDTRCAHFFSKDNPAYRVKIISSGRLRFKDIAKILFGIAQSLFFMVKARPAIVVGFGGYPSFPPLLTAKLLGVKTGLHEQNALMGAANRILAKYAADFIALSFEETRGLPKSKSRFYFTGNPVRAAITAIKNAPYKLPIGDEKFRILVTGGSLGADIFSRIVPDALKLMPDNLRSRIIVVQQCRADSLEAVRYKYEEAGIEATLATFFSDMPDHLAACHLTICRAGASSVAEILAAARPAILVPFAAAKDNHQLTNANAAASQGIAWVMEETAFTIPTLKSLLESLLTQPERLTAASSSAKAWPVHNAAKLLADITLCEIPDAPA